MSVTGLTERQLVILRLKAVGLQDKEIAGKLGIGIQTVKNHIGNILQRLEVYNSTAAVVVAIREGDIDPDALEIARRAGR